MSNLPAPVVTSFEDTMLNFENVERAGIYAGSGAPTLQANAGDFYFRKDTPSTANQRIYVNTAAGSHWTGIL